MELDRPTVEQYAARFMNLVREYPKSKDIIARFFSLTFSREYIRIFGDSSPLDFMPKYKGFLPPNLNRDIADAYRFLRDNYRQLFDRDVLADDRCKKNGTICSGELSVPERRFIAALRRIDTAVTSNVCFGFRGSARSKEGLEFRL